MKVRKRKPLILGGSELTPIEDEGAAAAVSESENAPEDEQVEPPLADLNSHEDPEPAPEVTPLASSDLDFAVASPPDPVGDLRDLGEAPNLGAVRPLTANAEKAVAEPQRTTAVVAVKAAGPAWPIYVTALIVSVAWALAPLAFALGYRGRVSPFDYEPFALGVFALLCVGPAALIWLAAWLARQGQLVAAEARAARAMADRMLAPAALAAVETGGAVEQVRAMIDDAAAAASRARGELTALREVLAVETGRLVEAAEGSARTAAHLTQDLGREREALTDLSTGLDAQAAGIAEAITRQARMVAEASDLAETQLREAEAALTSRAADLAAAASETSDAARTAAEDLTRQAARLEAAGSGVTEQAKLVEDGLSEQRAGLVTVAHELRGQQEDFAARIESQQAALTDLLARLNQDASHMGSAAEQSAGTLRDLIVAASDQLKDLSEAAQEERDLFGASALQSLGAFAQAAGHERRVMEDETRAAIDALSAAAEQARLATEADVEAARQKVDQLGEAAFAAGQKADQVFEARLNEARALIEQSAQMVEDAGQRAAAKLTDGLASARQTLAELEAALAEVDARTARLPEDAQARAQEVRHAVEAGMGELMISARKAAEETQAIDAAFQERVRRNYDMLSEAVRLMGVVSGSPRRESALEARARQAAPAPARPTPPAPEPSPEPSADQIGLRPRLKLTPTATDEEFSTVFQQAGGQAPRAPASPAGNEWTWKDLLSSMDGGDGGGADDEQTADRLIGEIEAMGVDAGALLPRTRIEEIAQAVHGGEATAGRDLIRRLAPAATRRLSRRLLTDRQLNSAAERFVRRYETMVGDALQRDRDGFLIAALLGSDQGRAYLLLDAAIGVA